MPIQRIHLSDLWPSSAEPVRLFGAFDGADELIFASAPDLARQWMRYPDEGADGFARRICDDILVARGRPPLPGKASMQDRVGAEPIDAPRGRHPPRHDGAVPGRSHVGALAE